MKYKFLTLSLLLAGVCATTIKAQETNYYTPKWSDNIFISVGGGKYIENYITTIRNLAKYGVKVIIYNFMPVFDWLRTDLAREIPEDGSNSLYFDEKDLGEMTPLDIVKKTAGDSNGFSLPGWEPERLAELEKTLKQYENITADDLRRNYKYFLDAIIPVCEEVGVKMACHPDDPAGRSSVFRESLTARRISTEDGYAQQATLYPVAFLR